MIGNLIFIAIINLLVPAITALTGVFLRKRKFLGGFWGAFIVAFVGSLVGSIAGVLLAGQGQITANITFFRITISIIGSVLFLSLYSLVHSQERDE